MTCSKSADRPDSPVLTDYRSATVRQSTDNAIAMSLRKE